MVWPPGTAWDGSPLAAPAPACRCNSLGACKRNPGGTLSALQVQGQEEVNLPEISGFSGSGHLSPATSSHTVKERV